MIILEGRISILAALRAKKRKIDRILLQLDKQSKRNLALLKEARHYGIKTGLVSPEEINKLSSGKTHGGLIAIAGKRKYRQLGEIGLGSSPSFVAMLDGIEDPFNLGQAVRSLYAAGADAVILRKRDWSFAEATILKSSAGAWEYMPLAMVDSAEQAARYFKKEGFQIIYSGLEKRSVSLFEAELQDSLFILIGGEKRGINKQLKEIADTVIKIPYSRKFDKALDAAASSAIIAFEVFRQRSEK